MITRREFVVGAVAGLMAPRAALAANETWRRRVVVVGAGLAGLTAALDLVDQGWDVVVLEARDRVGGRVQTARAPFSPGLHAELGGESINEGHHALLAMVRRFNLLTERRQPQKPYDSMVYYRGKRSRLPVFVGRRNGTVLREVLDYFDAEAALGDGVDPVHPERARNAEQLDSRSADAFIRSQQLSAEADFIVRTMTRAIYAAEPRDISLLFVAQQAAQSAKEETTPLDEDLFFETRRIRGGNARLPNAMAAALGDRVHRGVPVHRVENHGERIRISAGSMAIDAAWAVMAVPPGPLRNITFAPALPSGLAAAVDGLELGDAVKVVREYDQAFWSAQGYSGFTIADLPFGVAWAATDSRATARGLLTQYITGDAAASAASLTDSARVAEYTSQLDRTYPKFAGLATSRAATYNWSSDKYSGGAYAVWKPGQMIPFFSPWQRGAGRIRFAGEHTCTLPGYMESAVRSGHRVAGEIGLRGQTYT